MTFKAVIIGIGRYGVSAMDDTAPAENALAVARWAKDAGVEGKDLLVFASSPDAGVAARFRGAGITVRDTDLTTIDTALRTELNDAPGGGGLILYWCGHGMTQNDGARILFCSDYKPALENRVLDLTLFIRKLRSATYGGYGKQLVLADVCGVNSTAKVQPTPFDPGLPQARDQLVYFATPEGGYALADTGEGAFTHCALQALQNFQGFPDFEDFKARLELQLKQSNLPRFLVEGHAEDGNWESLYGRGAPTSDEAIDSLVERLVALAIPRTEADALFHATVSSLGNPRLLVAQGLTGMVRELGSLRDEETSVTHGLVQFVLRLIDASPDYRPSLETWLATWAKREIVESEQSRLQTELERSLLIVDIEANREGAIVALRPSLRTFDQTRMRGRPLAPISVQTWQDVEDGMLALLGRLSDDGFTDLEIHFVIELTVFDRPFHRLRGPGGQCLGEEFGVVLHSRERVLPNSTPAKRAYAARLDAVRCLEPAALTWTRCGQGRPLPLSPDLCIAEWPPKLTLARLVLLGAPGIYWPHAEGEADAEPDLTTLVRTLNTLAAMPDAIRKKRVADMSESGSLLWDAMTFRPYGG